VELLQQNRDLTRLLQEDHDMIRTLFTQHKTDREEWKKQCVVPSSSSSSSSSSVTFIQNNTFHLNFFLNEQCKDALSMMEFLDTLQISHSDIEFTGSHGCIDGISHIFIKGLQQLDIFRRPIHCTDKKREVIYVKNNNGWNKDSEEKTSIRHALSEVMRKNILHLKEWQKDHPQCFESGTEDYECHMKIIRETIGHPSILQSSINTSMITSDSSLQKDTKRMIKNVIKEIIVDKHVT
jgi:hypothetical protein